MQLTESCSRIQSCIFSGSECSLRNSKTGSGIPTWPRGILESKELWTKSFVIKIIILFKRFYCMTREILTFRMYSLVKQNIIFLRNNGQNSSQDSGSLFIMSNNTSSENWFISMEFEKIFRSRELEVDIFHIFQSQAICLLNFFTVFKAYNYSTFNTHYSLKEFHFFFHKRKLICG